QQDTQLLLLSFAAGSGYQVANEIFQRLLGHDELNFLLDEMQVAEKNYQELNNISKQRAQAFLVLTSLSATVGARANSAEEKTRRMALIRQCMGETLSMEVQHVLTKHGSHHDWETLEKDLRLILDGNYEDTTSSLQMDDVKKQLESLWHKKEVSHTPKSNEKKSNEVIENKPFLDILQRVGLEHYYPRRMSRADFHLIYKNSVYNTQPKSEQELP
ncbi:interferon-induced very large GTPase 1-like, partial [Nannospalax galili]|uniref:interferon-induced very large GTPase 1-like n=1 Tax=Nannospalax galili TaxID=1026970 RepID=UPI00081A0F1C